MRSGCICGCSVIRSAAFARRLIAAAIASRFTAPPLVGLFCGRYCNVVATSAAGIGTAARKRRDGRCSHKNERYGASVGSALARDRLVACQDVLVLVVVRARHRAQARFLQRQGHRGGRRSHTNPGRRPGDVAGKAEGVARKRASHNGKGIAAGAPTKAGAWRPKRLLQRRKASRASALPTRASASRRDQRLQKR